jgi:hypothetical protein
MTLALNTGETIGGVAGTASAVACVITGVEIAGGVEAFKVLYQGLLDDEVGTLYTVPTSTMVIVRNVGLTNTSGDSVGGVIIYVNGADAAHQICGSTTIPAGSTFMRTDSGWVMTDSTGAQQSSGGGGGGSGDVVGPGSATDDAIARFDTETGKLIQNSLATVDDAGTVDVPYGQDYTIDGVASRLWDSIEYYVNCDTGDDGAPGTVGEPFETVQHALDLLPKNLGGHNAAIYLQDSPNYAESILVTGFYNGEIDFIGGTLVWSGGIMVSIMVNEAIVWFSGIGFYVNEDDMWAVASLQTAPVLFDACKFSKDPSVSGTAGVCPTFGTVWLFGITPPGAGVEVDYGVLAGAGSTVFYDDTSQFGTEFVHYPSTESMVMTEGGFMVSGPGPEVGSTDAAVAVMDGTRGVKIRGSLVTIDADGSVNIPSGEAYGIDGTPLAYGDVGAAAADHEHAAGDITSGSLDGDRLPALSTDKRGGVKETGTPSGKFLRDDDSWATAGGAYRRPATIVVAASDSADKTNVDFVCPATDALDYITTTVIPTLPAGGGKILLLEGNYVMTTNSKGIVIDRNNVTVEGMGQSTIIKFPANTVAGTLITCNYANCAFDNFQLKGVATGSAAQIGLSSGSALCVVSRLDINGFGPDGSSQGITGSGSVIVEGCHIHGNYYGVQGGFNLATVTECYLYGNVRPLYLGGNYITISNNLIESSTYGTYTYSGPGIGAQISGNIFNQTYGRCITHVGGKASITSNMFYITSLTYPAISASGSGLAVTGNTVTSDGVGDPSAAPFSVDAGTNSIISGNVYNAAGAARCGYGLQIGSGAVGFAVMRNSLCFTVAPILDAGTQTTFGDAKMTSLLNVLAEDVDAIVDNEDLNVSLPLTCTLDGQPDFGRNVTLALTDADDGISAINITVTGVISLGVTVTETFTFASFTAKVATGNYPFEKITEVKVNSATGIGAGDVLEVGIGKKLGLPGRIHDTGGIIWVKQNAAKTAAYTASATYGTVAPTTLTAADDFDIFWNRDSNIWAV